MNTIKAENARLVHSPWQTVHDFARFGQGAANIGFFTTGSNPPHTAVARGAVIVDGEVKTWWDPSHFWHALMKDKDGRLEILRNNPPMGWWRSHTLRDKIDWLCNAGPIVLWGGEVGVLDADKFPGVNPGGRRNRIAYGVNRAGDTLYAHYQPNATGEEMGVALRNVGAHNGILGDGGSSAQLKEPDGSFKGTARLIPNAVVWTPSEPPRGEPNWNLLRGQELNEFKVAPNFWLHEFVCSRTDTVKIHPELIRRLQIIRDHFGVPCIITSGYRSPEHNRAIGGVPGGTHEQGLAADIQLLGVTPEGVANFAEDVFADGGLGRYETHTHVDVRGRKARWDSR